MSQTFTKAEKSKRKAVSKRVRFEVFKRDGFVCHYCGSHPPSVILHVDHIVPVAGGGGNEIDNLVTSCESCNFGKGARALTVVPQSLSEKAKLLAEREEQLAGYQAIFEAKRVRLDEEMWRVAEMLDPGCGDHGISRQYLQSIRTFIDRLGVHETLDAAELAQSRFRYFGRKCFLYFCGICWRKIKGG